MSSPRLVPTPQGVSQVGRRRSVLAVVVGSVVWSTNSLVEAKPLSFTVETERSERAGDCIAALDLTNQIARLAPGALAIRDAMQVDVRVSVRFDRVDDEYRARLNFSGAKPGERLLSDRGPSCRSLGNAAAVTVALLLDREMAENEGVLPQQLPQATSSVRVSSAVVFPEARRGLGVNSYLSVQGGAAWGFVSRTAPGLEGFVGISPRTGWYFELGALGWLPQTVQFGPGEVTISLTALALQSCRLWGTVWQLGPCAAFALGRLHGHGRGFDESASTNLVWSATSGSVLLDRSVAGPLRIGVQATAWFLLGEQSLAVGNLGTAWNSSTIWLGLGLRVSTHFN